MSANASTLLRESDLTTHFVSSFTSRSGADKSFAAYKNSQSTLGGRSISGRNVASPQSQSRTTLKTVEPKVQRLRVSPQPSNKNTNFSSDVRKKLIAALLVATIFLVVLIPATRAFGGLSLGSSKGSDAVKIDKSAIKSVTVQSGDTLWSIAQELEPNKDPRGTVDKLIKARGTSSLEVGETIQWSK